jgi:hypothetical protein
MKILLALMCYIKYLSGYISYFDDGYFLILSDMLPLLGSKGYCGFHSHSVFLRTCGKTRFLSASYVRFPSYFYTSRYVTEVLVPTLVWMDSTIWGCERVVRNMEGISQPLLVTYSQASVVLILCFSQCSIWFFCVIINLWQCFCGNRSSL